MQPITRTTSDASLGPKYSSIVSLDFWVSPFNVALNVQPFETANYTVQYTFDDIFAHDYNPATGNWVDHPTLYDLSNQADSNLAYPVTAVRLVQNSGDGSCTMTVIQAGVGR